MPFFIQKLVKGKNICIATNPVLRPLYADALCKTLQDAGYTCILVELPSGESNKTIHYANQFIDHLIEHKFERHDTVIALGGGIVGDVIGFASSIYLRGINLIQCPTTLLAQVDASIGGKTGVNHSQGKNLIGTFYQPCCIVSDTQTLSTLPKREILCGLAEIVKYGIICDPPLFWYLEKNAEKIKLLSTVKHPEIWAYLIEKSAQNKGSIVEKDEREKDLRETLNFGHTIGHAIEAAFGYTHYLHGEAIALGMRAAAYLSLKEGLLREDTYNRIIDLLLNLGFTLELESIEPEKIISHLFIDKKIRHGKLRFVLPTILGSTLVREIASKKAILDAILVLLPPVQNKTP